MSAARARITVRPHTYRNRLGWKISGRDQQGRSVSIFSERESEARRMASEIKAGEQPRFDHETRSVARVMGFDPLKEPRAFAEALAVFLEEHAEKLRETAEGLTVWLSCERSGMTSIKALHPSHAANRLRKMAGEIDGGAKQ